jgi:DNA-binding MarR family transcriptional regulator
MKPMDINTRREKSIEIVNSLFFTSVFLQKTGNKQIAKFGLNQPQFAVLNEIVNNKDLSQKDILGEFLLEKSNLSKIIKKLEQMELILVSSSKADKRITILNATAKGRKTIKECMNDLDNLKEQFTEPLRDEELDSIHASIIRLEALVMKHRKEYNQKK